MTGALGVLKAMAHYPDVLETLLVQKDVWLQTPVDLCTRHGRRELLMFLDEFVV